MSDWVQRNDPMGGTVKGLILALFGVVFIAAGGLWLGVTFVVLGALLFALPLWMARRNEERLGKGRTNIERR